MKKKKGIRRAIPWIVLALIALILGVLPQLARKAAAGTEASVLTALAETGEIENTLAGGGTLTAEKAVKVTVPSSVEITEFLVKNGDRVEQGQALARVDRVTLLGAISDVQKSLEEVAFQMLTNANAYSVAKLTAQVNGRVKAVYAGIGDDVRQVTVDRGAVAVVSVDGLMVTEIPTDRPVEAGTRVSVKLPDGTEAAGRVETAMDHMIRVTLSDDGPRIGDPVKVYTTEGAEIGSGLLAVHNPWTLLATDGIVNHVYVKENQQIWVGNGIVEVEKLTGNTEYQALAAKHRQYEELMQELFALYEDDTVKAPNAGFVRDIDENKIKNTASWDKEYTIKLLANETTENTPELENCWGAALITSVNGDGTVTGLVMTRDQILAVLLEGASLEEILTGGTEMTFRDPGGAASGSVIILQSAPEVVTPSPSMPVLPDLPDFSGFDIGSLLGGFSFNISLPSSMMSGAQTEEEDDGLYDLEEQTILSITPDDSMTVRISVDELDVLQYELGMSADVTVDALPDRSFTAHVTEIGATGENSGGNSKYNVELRLDRAPDMLDGMNASVVVHRGSRSALLIPSAAVHDRGSRSYVYTALDNKTGKPTGEAQVETGISDGENVEIVSGLSEGQTVFYEYFVPREDETFPKEPRSGFPGNR